MINTTRAKAIALKLTIRFGAAAVNSTAGQSARLLPCLQNPRAAIVASYETFSCIMRRARMAIPSLCYYRIVLLMILCSGVCFATPLAQAHEPFGADTHTARIESGWSLEKADCALAFREKIAMIDPDDLTATGAYRGPLDNSASSGRYTILNDRGSDFIENVRNASLMPDTHGGDRGALVKLDWPPPRSLIDPFATRYLQWESGLADTSALVNEKGVLVYPLLQINFAGEHLPISLYLPSLRGSDLR